MHGFDSRRGLHALCSALLAAACLVQAGGVFAAEARKVSLQQARQLYGSDVQFVDVRSDAEWAGGHIPGAVHIPVDTTTQEDAVRGLDRGQPVLTYCASGGRAARAARNLVGQSFENVRYLAPGGFGTWAEAGYPVAQPATE